MATKADLLVFDRTVAAAGTAVTLATTTVEAQAVLIVAAKAAGANTGNVYLGNSSVDKTSPQQFTLEPGDSLTLPIGGDQFVNLYELYLDAANNDDGVYVMYTPAQ